MDLRIIACAALVACTPTTELPLLVSTLASTMPDMVTLHTLTDADGLAVRGAGAELDGRIYWLAGERGANGTANCSSTAHWNDIEHKQHCPGSLISIALDDSDFRTDYSFTQLDARGQNDDGYHPYGTPLAVGGCLVGVTQVGGHPTGAGVEATTAAGAGTLWRWCLVGGFETLHNFFATARAFDGEYPMGTPALLPDGRICGTTKSGGSASRGTVWCWSPTGFQYVALTAASGTGYGGVTYAGGLLHLSTNDGGANATGTYSTVDPATMTLTIVDSWPAFTGSQCCNDNTSIQAPLLVGGQLVMARQFEGQYGSGLLVRLTPAGIVTLKAFEGVTVAASPRFSNASGGMPNGNIIEAPNGMIMGAVAYGGALGAGGVYEIARDGTRFRLLYSCDPAGPSYPYGGLTAASNGGVYGTTFGGGSVFRFYPPTEVCQL